jgi:hypothetical protein
LAKNEEYFRQEDMLNAKGATNMQKQTFYSSIKAREKAKGHFVDKIS